MPKAKKQVTYLGKYLVKQTLFQRFFVWFGCSFLSKTLSIKPDFDCIMQSLALISEWTYCMLNCEG